MRPAFRSIAFQRSANSSPRRSPVSSARPSSSERVGAVLSARPCLCDRQRPLWLDRRQSGQVRAPRRVLLQVAPLDPRSENCAEYIMQVVPGRRERRRQHRWNFLAMPTVDRGRLDQHQRVCPPRPQLSQHQPEQTVRWAESGDSNERGRATGGGGQGSRAAGLDASIGRTGSPRPPGRRDTSCVQTPATPPTSNEFPDAVLARHSGSDKASSVNLSDVSYRQLKNNHGSPRTPLRKAFRSSPRASGSISSCEPTTVT